MFAVPIILIVLISGAIYYFVNQQAPSFNQTSDSIEEAYAPSSPGIQSDLQPSVMQIDSQTADALKAGGNSYLDTGGVFSFLYPSDYKMDKQGTFVRVYKNGPSQKGQTEMYDGVLILIEPVDLAGKSVSDWVDENIDAATMDGTSKVTKAKSAATVGSYTGFIYTIEGLGTSNHTVLQKDANSQNAVHIITAVFDPTEVGFESEVASILSTLQILK